MFAGGLRRSVVGRDDQQPVVEFLPDQPADRRPEPRFVTHRVDERDEPVGPLDDARAVGLAVRVVHPHRRGVGGRRTGRAVARPFVRLRIGRFRVVRLLEAVDGVRQVRGEAALDLVGLHVEEAARRAVAVVRVAGDQRPHERRLAVVDVARGADDDVVLVGLQHAALADRGEADDTLRRLRPVADRVLAHVADAPRVHVVDVRVGLLGQHREHVHRLREGLRRDAREPAVVGDAEHVRRLAVPREDAVAKLCHERLHAAVREVDLAGEPFLELDGAAVLLPALDGPPYGGPVRAHGRSYARTTYNGFRAVCPHGTGALRSAPNRSGAVGSAPVSVGQSDRATLAIGPVSARRRRSAP